MQVSIDRVACAGVGICAGTAPNVFGIDDEDFLVVLLDDDPDESERADVDTAALYCPNAAITVRDQ